MTIKTTIGSAQGTVQTNEGSGLVVIRETGHSGFSPFRVYDVKAITSLTTMSIADAGVTTVSGTAGIVAILMPSASACPGALFTFRNLSADSHYLSGSEYGVKNFNNGTTAGTRLQLANVIGQSVTLMCDGTNFVVLGSTSASITIANN